MSNESVWWDGTGVTSASLRKEVERLAIHAGDTRARCLYTITEEEYNDQDESWTRTPVKPECVVGQAVFNLTGKYVPGSFEGCGISNSIWRNALGQDLSGQGDDDFQFVLNVQSQQDNNQTWRDALRIAKMKEEENNA